MSINRGDVILVRLDPVLGSEQGKTRPCLVIQNNNGNSVSPTTIVASITSTVLDTEHGFLVKIKAGEGKLPKDSTIQLNQIRTISISHRVIKKIGSLNPEIMRQVDEAIKTSLALD